MSEKLRSIGPDLMTIYTLLDASRDNELLRFQYFRQIFIDPVDVDEYIELFENDELLDLTRKQINMCVSDLRAFRSQLVVYLSEADGRILCVDDDLRQNVEEWADASLKPREIEGLVRKRIRLAKMFDLIELPRGLKEKSLREVASQYRPRPKIETKEVEPLLQILKARFQENMHRHAEIDWVDVQAKLENNLEGMWSLLQMEKTLGEPDVVGIDEETGKILYYDCSKESPEGRRNIVFNSDGERILKERYGETVSGNAIDMAKAMGIEVLTKLEHMEKLQSIGDFDQESWSWVIDEDQGNEDECASYCDGDDGGRDAIYYHDSAISFRGKILI
jgi:Protein of unknown function (DUF4256)